MLERKFHWDAKLGRIVVPIAIWIELLGQRVDLGQAVQQRITIADTELLLLSERAIYWPEQKALLVAELYLGKSGHFQKHGIPIFGEVHFRDLDILGTLLQRHLVERSVF